MRKHYVVALYAVMFVMLAGIGFMSWRTSRRLDELAGNRQQIEHQELVETISEIMDDVGVRPEELITEPARIESRHEPHDHLRTARHGLNCSCARCAGHDTYVFDPAYGMRRQSDFERLRRPLETAEDYKRMHEQCRRVARAPVYPISDWEAFARDVNRRVPTAEEFAAIERGDRSLWVTD
jgi:hypothetical protein